MSQFWTNTCTLTTANALVNIKQQCRIFVLGAPHPHSIPKVICRHLAACSRNLVAKQCLGLPVPLWIEIMTLMGGEHRKSADQARKQAF